jgi:hypothetical protein
MRCRSLDLPDCNAFELLLETGVVLVHDLADLATHVEPVDSDPISPVDQPQHVLDLEVEHQDDRVPAVGIGSVEDEEVGEATGRDAETCLRATLPGLVDL